MSTHNFFIVCCIFFETDFWKKRESRALKKFNLFIREDPEFIVIRDDKPVTVTKSELDNELDGVKEEIDVKEEEIVTRRHRNTNEKISKQSLSGAKRVPLRKIQDKRQRIRQRRASSEVAHMEGAENDEEEKEAEEEEEAEEEDDAIDLEPSNSDQSWKVHRIDSWVFDKLRPLESHGFLYYVGKNNRVFKDKEPNIIQNVCHLTVFQEFAREHFTEEEYAIMESKVFWNKVTYCVNLNRFKFKFGGKICAKNYTVAEAYQLTKDDDLLGQVMSLCEMSPNSTQWYTRLGFGDGMAGSVKSCGTVHVLHELPKGSWANTPIIQYDGHKCAMASILSATPKKFILDYDKTTNELECIHDNDGFANLRKVVHIVNRSLKRMKWIEVVEYLGPLKKDRTFSNCFRYLLTPEFKYRMCIISFLCHGTIHVFSVDLKRRLILDSDIGEGRERAFSFHDTCDISVILSALFDVHMEDNVLKNVFTRVDEVKRHYY